MDDTLEQLIKSIQTHSIVYLPKKKIELFTNNDLSDLEEYEILNHLFYIGEKVASIKNDPEHLKVIKKQGILKNNTFTLLKLKSTLDSLTFEYIKNEYFNQVNGWLIIYEFIKDNAKKDATNYTPSIQGLLDLQYFILQKHSVELQRLLSSTFKGLQQQNTKTNFLKKTNQNQNNTTPTPTNTELFKEKKQKSPYPTEKEIDNYLLKHVFNVKL